MDDKNILDWIQEHLTDFRETVYDGVDDDGKKVSIYDMGWLDDDGVHHSVRGRSLRDCVKIAINQNPPVPPWLK
jgi:hypothetical protein